MINIIIDRNASRIHFGSLPIGCVFALIDNKTKKISIFIKINFYSVVRVDNETGAQGVISDWNDIVTNDTEIYLVEILNVDIKLIV